METMEQPMFAEFACGDLFDLVNPRGKLTTRQLIEGSDLPYVAAKKTNNGVAKMCSSKNIPDEDVMPGGAIVFVQQGDGAAGYTTYQPDPFYAISCVCCGYNEHLTEGVGMYLMAQLDKNKTLYSHSQSWNSTKIRQTALSLPVTPHADPSHVYTPDDIDWAYMERYIAELEQERIAELDAYLKAAGLDDCELTAEDEAALAEQPVFAEFLLKDLFECEKGDVDLQQKDINGKGELFINSGLENKGIKGRTDKPAKVFPAGTLTIDFWGNAFYRDEPYKLATHNHVFSLSGDVLKNEVAGLYVEATLAKLPQLFSYTNMATWPKLQKLALSLPVFPSTDPDHAYTPDDIDWAYMERYIRAIEKQVVTGVVEYKDKVIETTKLVIFG